MGSSIPMNAVPGEDATTGGFVKGPKGFNNIPIPISGGGEAVSYIMRGYDQTLLTLVFWTSLELDGSAADYTGPGPVVDVVLHFVKGPPPTPL